jgi:hypothetical protein
MNREVNERWKFDFVLQNNCKAFGFNSVEMLFFHYINPRSAGYSVSTDRKTARQTDRQSEEQTDTRCEKCIKM